jgi:hypothetical protein
MFAYEHANYWSCVDTFGGKVSLDSIYMIPTSKKLPATQNSIIQK